MKKDARDFIGYGRESFDPKWPKKSRLAINFIINVEEGSEYSPLMGDSKSESGLSEVPGGRHKINQRDLAIESIYEYGSRVGFWRLTTLLEKYKMPHTFFVCALTLLQNKEISSFIPSKLLIYGYTKNLKQAADEIGFPGKPKTALGLPFILANRIGFPGLIATLLK